MSRVNAFISAALLFLGADSATAEFRIAYSSDGNQHDADDWHASPLALAMIAAAGVQDRLVHFDYNNHLGDNDVTRAETHRRRVDEAIERYGYERQKFFDDQHQLAAAVTSIAHAIDASGPDDRLFLLCAGPMEVCWRGIDAARDTREPFVTVVSHGNWNETHADTPELRRTWADIERDFDVDAREILTQNATDFRSDPAAWNWLRQVRHGEWLHRAVAEGRKAGDASDAGMVFYVLDGRGPKSDRATMADIRALFAQSG